MPCAGVPVPLASVVRTVREHERIFPFSVSGWSPVLSTWLRRLAAAAVACWQVNAPRYGAHVRTDPWRTGGAGRCTAAGARSVGAAGVIPVPCGGVLRTPGAGVLMPAPAGQGDNDGLALRKKKKNQDSAHRHVGPLLVPCAPTRRQACRRPAAVRRCACGLPMASALRRFTATQPRHAGRQQGNRQNEANRKS
jgi:hypothetical protein